MKYIRLLKERKKESTHEKYIRFEQYYSSLFKYR